MVLFYNSSPGKSDRLRIAREGGIKYIALAMQQFPKNYNLQLACINALFNLCYQLDYNKTLAGNIGIRQRYLYITVLFTSKRCITLLFDNMIYRKGGINPSHSCINERVSKRYRYSNIGIQMFTKSGIWRYFLISIHLPFSHLQESL